MAKSNLSSLVSVLMSVVSALYAHAMTLIRRVGGFLEDPTGRKRLDAAIEMKRRTSKVRLAASHGDVRRRIDRHLKEGNLSFVRQDLPHLEQLRCEYNSRCKKGEVLIPCEKQEIERAIEAKQAEMEAAEAEAMAEFAQREQELALIADFASTVRTGHNLCGMKELDAAKVQVAKAREIRKTGNKMTPVVACNFQLIKELDEAIKQLEAKLQREAKAASMTVKVAVVEASAPVIASTPKVDEKAAKRAMAKRKAAKAKLATHIVAFRNAMAAGLDLCKQGKLAQAEEELIKARTARNAANAEFRVARSVDVDMYCEEEVLPLVDAIEAIRPKVIETLAEIKERQQRSAARSEAEQVNTCIHEGLTAVRVRKYMRAQFMFDQAKRLMEANPFIAHTRLVDMGRMQKLGRDLSVSKPKVRAA